MSLIPLGAKDKLRYFIVTCLALVLNSASSTILTWYPCGSDSYRRYHLMRQSRTFMYPKHHSIGFWDILGALHKPNDMQLNLKYPGINMFVCIYMYVYVC